MNEHSININQSSVDGQVGSDVPKNATACADGPWRGFSKKRKRKKKSIRLSCRRKEKRESAPCSSRQTALRYTMQPMPPRHILPRLHASLARPYSLARFHSNNRNHIRSICFPHLPLVKLIQAMRSAP